MAKYEFNPDHRWHGVYEFIIACYPLNLQRGEGSMVFDKFEEAVDWLLNDQVTEEERNDFLKELQKDLEECDGVELPLDQIKLLVVVYWDACEDVPSYMREKELVH